MRVSSCRLVVAAATAMLMATGLQAPAAAARQTQPAQPGPLHLPIVLAAAVGEAADPAAINEAPTTLGIADSNLYNLAPVDIDKTLDELQALGVKDIRIAVPWVYIQPTDVQPTDPDRYDWAKLDYVVNAAEARDMSILGVITSTPAWAGPLLNGHPDIPAYAGFTRAVATRYAGKIGAYEIWNEPNGKIFWSPVSASAYADLLKAAYPAIKAADPNARVIGGVLGSVSTIPGLSQSPIAFVRDMYSAGAHGYFDALSIHPYHYVTPFSQGDVTEAPINQVAAIRQLMVANGDGRLKLWATEYGLPTSSVSQSQQAAFIHDFVASWQHVDGAGPIFLYTTRDSNTGGFDDEENFGLFQTDWTKKAAADTVAGLITDLADGSAEPFDVTPYLPSNGFLQSVVIFVKQVINQLLVVPKFVGQIVGSVIKAVVQFVTTGLGILAGVKPAAAFEVSTPAGATVSEQVESRGVLPAKVIPVKPGISASGSTLGTGRHSAEDPAANRPAAQSPARRASARISVGQQIHGSGEDPGQGRGGRHDRGPQPAHPTGPQ